MDVDAKLKELFIELPEPGKTFGSVAHAMRSGKLLFVSGALPFADGKLLAKGRVGIEVRLDLAKSAMRTAFIQALCIVAMESKGTLNQIKQILRLEGYIASGADFGDHLKVLDGASELAGILFGNAGRHSRSAVGVASLPLNACVQLSTIFEMK